MGKRKSSYTGARTSRSRSKSSRSKSAKKRICSINNKHTDQEEIVQTTTTERADDVFTGAHKESQPCSSVKKIKFTDISAIDDDKIIIFY